MREAIRGIVRAIGSEGASIARKRVIEGSEGGFIGRDRSSIGP
jgi:hypothetical protein